MTRTKRQRNREGSIYPVAVTVKGKVYTYWTVARELGVFNGKRQRETFRYRTEKEARAKLGELLRSAPKQAGPNLKLEPYLKQWLANKRQLAPTTVRRHEEICRVHINPALGQVRLDRIGPDDVERLIDVVSRKRTPHGPISPSTVVRVWAVLSAALNDAKRKRMIPYNPAESVQPPQVAAFKGHPFSPEDAARFFKTVNGDPISPVFATALGLGLRLGETLGLTWDKIEADWRGIQIEQQLQWLEPRYVEGKPVIRKLAYQSEGKVWPYLVKPKTKASVAWLPLPEEVATILQAHKARQSAAQLAGKWRNVDNLVFTTAAGTPYSDRNVLRAYQDYLREAGLSKNRFHDLRHSCISFLQALGVEPKTASVIARHANVRTTLDIYTHISPEQKRRAIDLIGQLMPKAATP